MQVRIAFLIIVAAIFTGCDVEHADRARTARQIDKVRSGELALLIHPVPAELLASTDDALVVQNLKELVLTGDLAPYVGKPLGKFDQITEIELYCTINTDQFLALLPLLPKLKQLSVCETGATDVGINKISQCKSLEGIGITSWVDVITADSINELSNVKTLKQVTLEIASQKLDLSKLRDSLPECEVYETVFSDE